MNTSVVQSRSIMASATSVAGGFVKGQTVVLHGLESEQGRKLNGLAGRLGNFDAKTERWSVVVKDALKRVRPQNLAPVRDGNDIDGITSARIQAACGGSIGIRTMLQIYYNRDPARFRSTLVLCETHLRNVPNGLYRLYKDVCGEDTDAFEAACDAILEDPQGASGRCAKVGADVVFLDYLMRSD